MKKMGKIRSITPARVRILYRHRAKMTQAERATLRKATVTVTNLGPGSSAWNADWQQLWDSFSEES